jgi:hypothetical protein
LLYRPDPTIIAVSIFLRKGNAGSAAVMSGFGGMVAAGAMTVCVNVEKREQKGQHRGVLLGSVRTAREQMTTSVFRFLRWRRRRVSPLGTNVKCRNIRFRAAVG